MSDLISRQAAIDAIRASVSKYTGFMEMEMYTDDDAVEAINGVPSAQPDFNEWCTDCKEYDQERHCCPRYNRVIREALDAVEKPKTGKWIVDNVETEHCSVCKHRFYISALFAVGGNDEPPSCPNCGADMRGDVTNDE